MGDLRRPGLMYLKGVLLLFIGVLSSGLILLESPSVEIALLLAIAVWGFCRAYYFAFYVVDHYIDPGSRYSGLWDFATRELRRRASTEDERER